MHYGNVFPQRYFSMAGTPGCLVLENAFYHVDGFHFVGDGVPTELPKGDPILCRTKKMFSHVPEGAESSDMLAEYNPAFLQDMRRYLKSDEGMIPACTIPFCSLSLIQSLK